MHAQGYPDLVGLHYKGMYMGYPYPIMFLCALWGPRKGGTRKKPRKTCWTGDVGLRFSSLG